MVRVETLFVNGASESFESVGEVTGEPYGHVRCSERGDTSNPAASSADTR